MIAKYSLLVATTIILTAGCEEPTSTIDIADDVAREKYLEILESKSIQYTVDDNERIHVRMDLGELEARMQEYQDWEGRYFNDRIND